MTVNVHDILSYTADVVLGRRHAKDGEKGWTKGEWHDGPRVCLGAGLRVAEHDLVEGIVSRHYERDLDYRDAIDAQAVLANAIIKRHPELTDNGTIDQFSHPRDIIIAFNDATATSEDDIGEVLELADKMVWEQELEAELAKHPAGATIDESFLSYINRK